MNKDKLSEAGEERFRRLMEIIAKQEGQRLLALNERMKNDPAAQVPEKIDRSCLTLIYMGASGPRYRLWCLRQMVRRWFRRLGQGG